MNSASFLLSDAVVRVGAAFFVDAVILGTGIWLAAVLVCRVPNWLSAADRHRVWLLGVLGLLFLPLLGRVQLWTMIGHEGVDRWASTDGLQAEFESSSPGVVRTHQRAVEAGEASPPADGLSPRATDRRPPVWFADPALAEAVILIWAAMAGGLLVRFGYGVWQVRALRRRASFCQDDRLKGRLADLRRQVGIRRPVVLLATDGPSMPLTWGGWRPVVLLPRAAGEWSSDRCQAVMLHELAHVKRWDCTTQRVAEFARAILWFHPLAWVAVRQMRLEREMACDDVVLASGCRASDYAEHLVAISQLREVAGGHPALAMAHPKRLASRVDAILEASRRRRKTRYLSVGAALVLAMGLAVPRPVAIAGDSPTGGAPVLRLPELGAGSAGLEGLRQLNTSVHDQLERVKRLQDELSAFRNEHVGLARARRESVGSLRDSYETQLARTENLRVESLRSLARVMAISRDLEGLPPAQRQGAILTLFPDDKLMEHLAVILASAEVDAEVAKDTPGEASAEYRAARERVEVIQRKLDERISGLMRGLETQVAAFRAVLDELDAQRDRIQAQAAEQGQFNEELRTKERDLENAKFELDVLNRRLVQELLATFLFRESTDSAPARTR